MPAFLCGDSPVYFWVPASPDLERIVRSKLFPDSGGLPFGMQRVPSRRNPSPKYFRVPVSFYLERNLCSTSSWCQSPSLERTLK
ncbi:Hypothetical predicted protein [Pelobates cultripes]|uniref:Uncharacterized protein n=1 Tax=Pelobates cultripes TaxID=61616 RepID=A0AAD1RD63_PELCU|nr:Hypothetical predicted protein [Pelobates cultripes]